MGGLGDITCQGPFGRGFQKNMHGVQQVRDILTVGSRMRPTGMVATRYDGDDRVMSSDGAKYDGLIGRTAAGSV
jgi:hypothetical protein